MVRQLKRGLKVDFFFLRKTSNKKNINIFQQNWVPCSFYFHLTNTKLKKIILNNFLRKVFLSPFLRNLNNTFSERGTWYKSDYSVFLLAVFMMKPFAN